MGNSRKMNLIRFLVITTLLLICVGLEYYFHFLLGIDIICTYFFYVPVVLAAFWWGLKGGLLVSLLLALLYIVPPLFKVELIISTRSIALILVGFLVGIMSDWRKQVENVLRESEGKLNSMLQSIGDHMSMMDKDLNILWANETAKKIFGDDIIGKKCYEAYHGRKEPCEPYPCLTLKAFQDGKVHEHDTQVIDKDGKIIYFHCIANVALRDGKGKPKAVIEISRDITKSKKIEKEKEKLVKELERQARIDGLTGISNRQYLDKKLGDEGQRIKRYNHPLSVIMLDVDDFKKVNDSFGHKVGDKALRIVAESIKETIRINDFVGRYGGEEFLVVCVETEIDEAMSVAERIRTVIEKLQVEGKEGVQIKLTASLGVAQYNGSESVDELVTRADDALYRAKGEGRNKVYIAEGN